MRRRSFPSVWCRKRSRISNAIIPWWPVIANPANLDALLPSLRLAELDFIVAGIGTPEQMAGIQYDVLFQERLCLAARQDHPLAGKKRVTPKELHGYPWFILHPYRDFRDHVENLFAAAALEFPRNFIEAGHNIAADYLRQSDAVAILPYNLAAESVEAGSLIELPTDRPLPGYPVGILRREGAGADRDRAAFHPGDQSHGRAAAEPIDAPAATPDTASRPPAQAAISFRYR